MITRAQGLQQRLDYAVRTSFVRGRRLSATSPFAVAVNHTPAGVRLGLRACPRWHSGAWLRHWRRHTRRVFWHLDPATGRWRRL